MKRTLACAVVCAASLCALSANGLAADSSTPASARWTQFRGPNASGIADDQADVPVEFGPEKNVLWKTELPPGASSPCIWDDHIFLTGFEKTAKKLEVICIDRSEGKVLWRRDVNAKEIE